MGYTQAGYGLHRLDIFNVFTYDSCIIYNSIVSIVT